MPPKVVPHLARMQEVLEEMGISLDTELKFDLKQFFLGLPKL